MINTLVKFLGMSNGGGSNFKVLGEPSLPIRLDFPSPGFSMASSSALKSELPYCWNTAVVGDNCKLL